VKKFLISMLILAAITACKFENKLGKSISDKFRLIDCFAECRIEHKRSSGRSDVKMCQDRCRK